MALTHDTLTKLNQDYVNLIASGNLPPSNPEILSEPLILKLQKIPMYGRRVLGFGGTLGQGEAIFVLYDIGGEVFKNPAKIRDRIPILRKIRNVVCLVDLPRLHRESEEYQESPDMHFTTLLNTMFLAHQDLMERQTQNIIVGFTCADRMRGKINRYGPLAEYRGGGIPTPDGLRGYLDEMEVYSKEISGYVQEEFPNPYGLLHHYFRNVRFSPLSSLGCEPEGASIPTLNPWRVLDPLFWTLRFDGKL
ncbi:MAG: hypothetical protein ABIK09_05870 [Pseudomonadota bacterium]